MANWCNTEYVVKGNREEIVILRKHMQDLLNSEKSPLENDFGSGWLGNLVHILGGDVKEIYCRGSIEYVEEVIGESDELRFSTQTTWRDMRETMDFIQTQLPSLQFFFFAEEFGCSGCWTNDKEGRYFPERFFIDQLDAEQVSYKTLQEVLEDISQRLGKPFNTKDEMDAAIELFNQTNEDDCITVYDIDIVDENGKSI